MKRIFLNISVLTAILVMFYSCEKDDTSITYGTITDQDGNVYKTVIIGTQTWMAENLRTTKYNDGTIIPNVTGAVEWDNLTTGAFCNYNNTTSTDTITSYGRLYNWYAVNTGKLAPIGWHVPTDVEWTTLTMYLAGELLAGGKLKETGTTHWYSPNIGATNETGFTALPGGCRYGNGPFNDIGRFGDWWNATQEGNGGCNRLIGNDANGVYKHINNEKIGLSVRCVRD